MIVQLSPITNYKHPFTTAYNTNCFPASSCQVCIQYYSMISSWLVKLNCIPIYMLSCELTQMWKSTVYIYIHIIFRTGFPMGFPHFLKHVYPREYSHEYFYIKLVIQLSLRYCSSIYDIPYQVGQDQIPFNKSLTYTIR